MLPLFVVFIIFRLMPMIHTMLSSVFHNGYNTQSFIGIERYIAISNDALFWQSILNTLIIFLMYLIIKLILLIPLSIFILERKSKHIAIFLIYIPTLIGMFSYAIIFRYLFTYNGFINQVLEWIINTKIDWFGNGFFAKVMMVIALLWGGFGFYFLIYASSLKNIHRSYYEVLDLNGGNYFDKLKYVIIPMTMPMIKTITILSFIEVLTLIDLPINLTMGGPLNQTLTVSYYIYKRAIDYGDFGYAAALGVIVMAIAIIPSLLSKRKVEFAYEMD